MDFEGLYVQVFFIETIYLIYLIDIHIRKLIKYGNIYSMQKNNNHNHTPIL